MLQARELGKLRVLDDMIGITPAAQRPVSCTGCALKAVCLPSALGAAEAESFSTLARVKRKVRRDTPLFFRGDAFEALYVVRSGAFKTVSVSRNGAEKVTGFYLPGDILGLDAISGRTHRYDTFALEDSEVCAIQFAGLERMASAVPALQQEVFRALSGDISRDQGLMLLLGSMTAEQRLAAFLLSLARRHQRLGYSAEFFVLRMTRDEIGSYLGLTIETVSRVFSRFRRDGMIAVHHREIVLKDSARLTELVGAW